MAITTSRRLLCVALFLALLSSMLWGVSDFAGGTASRRIPALVVVGASQAAGLTAAVLLATFVGAWGDPTGYLWWAVAAGLVEALALVSFYQALASGTMGIVSPIAAMGATVPVVIGIATGHWPTIVAGVGIVLALIGVVLSSGPERAAGRSLMPVALAMVAAAGFGTTLVLIDRAARFSPVMTVMTMRVSSVTALTLVVLVLHRAVVRQARRLTREHGAAPGLWVWLVVATAGVFDMSSNLAFGWASTTGTLTIVAVLGSLYPAVTVVLARVIHRETMARIQHIGVVVALTGVVLIAGWS